MSKNEIKILTAWIGIMVIIFMVINLCGCDGGWSIGGWEVK
jgi:hypothetical protein